MAVMAASFFLFLSLVAAATAATRCGVNYGRVADNLPPPSQVAALTKNQGITKLKIFDADAAILQAFTGTGNTVVITIPNSQIPEIAASQAGAQSWFEANALPYAAEIEAILVGNEVLKFSPEMSPILVPAMQNMYQVLSSHGLSDKIKISTPHAMDVLERNSSSPPSNGVFKQRHFGTMRSLLDFLKSSNSFFMLNVYPYFAFREDKGATLSAEFALFQSAAPVLTDPKTMLKYTNLLDAQLDAVYAAIQKLGHSDVAIVIGETGWPTAGGYGASPKNAAIFTKNLIQRTQQLQGTPARPEFPVQAYLFALFNEDLKHNIMEQHFGLFFPNMSKVYPIDFAAPPVDKEP